jgi:hypothetical protein
MVGRSIHGTLLNFTTFRRPCERLTLLVCATAAQPLDSLVELRVENVEMLPSNRLRDHHIQAQHTTVTAKVGTWTWKTSDLDVSVRWQIN